jgi:hypothetical protein
MVKIKFSVILNYKRVTLNYLFFQICVQAFRLIVNLPESKNF